MPRFLLTIEGPNWKDLDDIELSSAPKEGEPIQTKFGVCLITSVGPAPSQQFAGSIVCRMP